MWIKYHQAFIWNHKTSFHQHLNLGFKAKLIKGGKNPYKHITHSLKKKISILLFLTVEQKELDIFQMEKKGGGALIPLWNRNIDILYWEDWQKTERETTDYVASVPSDELLQQLVCWFLFSQPRSPPTSFTITGNLKPASEQLLSSDMG